MAVHRNYVSTDKIKLLELWQNYFTFGVDAPDVDISGWFSKHLFTKSNGTS